MTVVNNSSESLLGLGRYATRLRLVGAEHSRQSTTDDGGLPLEVSTRRMRTTPLERHSRACQQLRRVHPQGPEAGERTDSLSEGSLAISDGLLMVTTTPCSRANFTRG